MDTNNQPEAVGRYQVKSKLGSGAAGIVYKADDPLLDRMVAIKVPRQASSNQTQKITKRFYHEAKISGQLHHPNIVTIHDVGRDQSVDFLVMECVPGEALDSYINKNGQLGVEEAVDIIYKCCLALDYMHFNEILHRDLKPANIMIDVNLDVVKIMDFGIAEKMNSDMSSGEGTPAYMAPELHSHEEAIGIPSEIFALGLVMYEMLAGQPAYRGDTITTTIYQILNTEATPISQLRSDVPEILLSVINKAMSKKSTARYQTALEFADALIEAVNEIRSTEAESHLFKNTHNNKAHYSLLRREFWFSNFAPDQINELLEAGSLKTFQNEEEIVIEGEMEEDFFIILSGEARVLKGHEEVGRLNKGECFGEMGYLSNEARTATIAAVDETMVWVVDPSFMKNLSPASQLGFYKTFVQLFIKRLTAATQDLAITKGMLSYLSQS